MTQIHFNYKQLNLPHFLTTTVILNDLFWESFSCNFNDGIIGGFCEKLVKFGTIGEKVKILKNLKNKHFKVHRIPINLNKPIKKMCLSHF
jgi:hypothetical protein